MPFKTRYNTRQGQQMLEYLESIGRVHFTAADARRYFLEHDIPLGTSTVYRQLEKLVSEGTIKKYVVEEGQSACYEYVGTAENNEVTCYHLKCEACGTLIHLACHEITEFENHITEHHGFHVNPRRTVFFGLCENCYQKERQADSEAGGYAGK